jgi:hypothetical protein
MNFRRWNYNSAIYGENLLNKQEQHFTFVTMGNLPDLLPNATPLFCRFLMKDQRNVNDVLLLT